MARKTNHPKNPPAKTGQHRKDATAKESRSVKSTPRRKRTPSTVSATSRGRPTLSRVLTLLATFLAGSSLSCEWRWSNHIESSGSSVFHQEPVASTKLPAVAPPARVGDGLCAERNPAAVPEKSLPQPKPKRAAGTQEPRQTPTRDEVKCAH
jgi:hypothetical protein